MRHTWAITNAAATSAMRLTSTFTAERMSNVTAGDVIVTGCTPSDSFAFVVDRVSGSWLDNCMTSTTTPATRQLLDEAMVEFLAVHNRFAGLEVEVANARNALRVGTPNAVTVARLRRAMDKLAATQKVEAALGDILDRAADLDRGAA